ncbi:hypothetical protein HMPREF9336_02271 [Segniliparus rugosus ATCC BAA-974]|uniref:O-methyltransferase YrrM n=2 Tax=Segniliparus rugosus TaxID=286804 RepID=E5XRZ9_SEGRC|nr:hypothetical protein HMPREF9336_02271 [Segniliparus rugosus ATCC BAA-974]
MSADRPKSDGARTATRRTGFAARLQEALPSREDERSPSVEDSAEDNHKGATEQPARVNPMSPVEPPAAEKLLAYAAATAAEDEPTRQARIVAAELGVPSVEPSVGAVLALFAASASAKAVVEIGTGAGVSGLWLLRGMRPDGVLTTIDADPACHKAAKAALVSAHVPAGRTRLITGKAQEVLPRLADGAYDLVHIDAEPTEQPHLIAESVRLLRPGGVLAVHAALHAGAVLDPDRHDRAAVAGREAARAIAEDERLLHILVPFGEGLLVAAVRHEPVER